MGKKCRCECKCRSKGSVTVTLLRRSGNDWLAVGEPIKTDLEYDNDLQAAQAVKPLVFGSGLFPRTRMALYIDFGKRYHFQEIGDYEGWGGNFTIDYDYDGMFLPGVGRR